MLPVSDLRSDSPLVLLCVSCVYLGLYTLCGLGRPSAVLTLFGPFCGTKSVASGLNESDFCLASSTVTEHRPDPRLPFCRIVSDSSEIYCGASSASPAMGQQLGCGHVGGYSSTSSLGAIADMKSVPEESYRTATTRSDIYEVCCLIWRTSLRSMCGLFVRQLPTSRPTERRSSCPKAGVL